MRTFNILMMLIALGLVVPPVHAAQLEIPGLAAVNAGWKMSKVEGEPDELHVMAVFRPALDRKTFRLTMNGVDFTPFLQSAGENFATFSLPMPVQALEITIEGHPQPDATITTRQRTASTSLRELVDVPPAMSASLPAIRGDRRDLPDGIRMKLPPRNGNETDGKSP